jgi:2-succinyl-6-hydroxy-2,4-cyclohexadiene-1-carboxylate synthase
VQLHYTWYGDAKAPVILFLHGFMGSGRDFEEIVPFLVDRWSCLCLDLPGHGASLLDWDKAYTMSQTANLVMQVLDHCGIAVAHLYGYSMGGRLGLYLALRFPQRFAQVILESASAGLEHREQRLARQARDRQLAQALVTDFVQFLQGWYDQPLFASLRSHPGFSRLWQSRLQNHPHYLAKALMGLGTGNQPSLWQKLGHGVPELRLLVGEKDPKFVQLNQRMASLCPAAILRIVPDTGHNIHFENPTAVMDELLSYRSFVTLAGG